MTDAELAHEILADMRLQIEHWAERAEAYNQSIITLVRPDYLLLYFTLRDRYPT